MSAERVDWRHEPTLSSKSTRSSNTSRVPLLSACAPLESLPVFFVHKAVIRHRSLSHLATALPHPSTGPTYGPSVNTMS